MSETAVSKLFGDRLRERDFMVGRMETHSSNPGAPDTHGLRKSVEIWIEFKWGRSIQDNHLVRGMKKLRDAQVIWHEKYLRHGGVRNYIILKTDKEGIYIFHGKKARILKTLPSSEYSRHNLAHYVGPKFDWDDIVELLLEDHS